MRKTLLKNTLLITSGVMLATGFGIFASNSGINIQANITNLVQYLKEFIVTTDGTPSGGELLHVSGSGIVVDSNIIPQESSSDLLALNASGQVVKTTGGGGVSVSFGVPTNSTHASNSLVITSAPSVSELTGKQIVIGDTIFIFYSSADGELDPTTGNIYGINLSRGPPGEPLYSDPTTGNLQMIIGQAIFSAYASNYFVEYQDDFGNPLEEGITATAYLAGTSQNGIVTSTDAPGMSRQNETLTGGDTSGTPCTPGNIYLDTLPAGSKGDGTESLYLCITDGAWIQYDVIPNRDLADPMAHY